MKPDIHPEYRDVVFLDTQNGTSFITRSTIRTEETTEVDGVTYPLAKVEISAASHPFYTGTMTIIDTAGRVERFEKRYGRRKQKGGAAPEAQAPEAEAPAAEATPEPEPPAEAPEAVAEEAPGAGGTYATDEAAEELAESTDEVEAAAEAAEEE